MSRLSDHRNRMTLSRFADEEIELLLSSRTAPDPEIADLASFLTSLHRDSVNEPPAGEVDRVARRAAAIA